MRIYKDPVNKQNKYVLAIKHMVAENRESLEVDYNDLAHELGEPDICYFLPEAPTEVPILKQFIFWIHSTFRSLNI